MTKFELLGLISYLPALIGAGIVSRVVFSFKPKETYIWFIVAGIMLDIVFWAITGYKENHTVLAGSIIRSLFLLLSLYTLFATYYYAIEKHYLGFFIVVYLLFVIVVTIDYLNIPACTFPGNFTSGLYSGIAAFTSIVYFYILMLKSPTTHIHLLPFFWFNTGIFFYHTASLWLTTVTQTWGARADGIHQLFEILDASVKQLAILICVNLYLKTFKNNKTK